MIAFTVPVAVLLAAVFAVSAIGKLRAPDRGRGALRALRLPVRNPTGAAFALIAVEGAVAVALLVTTGWLFVATGSAALLLSVGLLIVVVRAHRDGSTDDCGCFGDWLPAAIGPRLIVRNALLAVSALALLVAAAVSVSAGSAPVGVPSAFTSSLSAPTAVASLGAGILIAATVWAIARAGDAGRAQTDDAPRGAGAVLLPQSGEIVDVLAPASRARLLVFVSPGCHACVSALESLDAARNTVSAIADLYVIQRAVGGAVPARSAHEVPEPARFALDIGGSLATVLGLGPGTPVAALIGMDGTQVGPLALGSAEIALLLDGLSAAAEAASS